MKNIVLFYVAYIPPHLRGGGGGTQQRSAEFFSRDSYYGGRSGGRGTYDKEIYTRYHLRKGV